MQPTQHLKIKKRYKANPLPYDLDLSQFAPSYTPEKFTKDELKFLKPFFTNVDKPVFIARNLPEEVIGALSSRYSRSVHSIRRMFLEEYIKPIAYPDRQKNWAELSKADQKQANVLSQELLEYIEFLNSPHGSLDKVLNVQRGRKFFQIWLAGYGDDSIEELGGVHLFCEGISSLVLEEIVNKRIGISPLVKSSRYVSFSDRRADGDYQYLVPGEIRGSKYEAAYRQAMDQLFDLYSQISEPYLDYIKQRYPQEADETDRAFNGSRGAKRFDDIRDLLPFATQNNIAMFGNGRAFEDLIARLLDYPIGEYRWLGQAITNELAQIVPSFVERPQTERGAQVQIYRTNLLATAIDLAKELKPVKSFDFKAGKWAKLVTSTPDADIEILAAFILSAPTDQSYGQIRQALTKLSAKKRNQWLQQILSERKLGDKQPNRQAVRFRKVPRAFEEAEYRFSLWARGGDYRDLHRHRQNTEVHPPFTTEWGYGLESEVEQSEFAEQFHQVFKKAAVIYQQLAKLSPYLAQYAIPFGYYQHWHMKLTARSIYWMVELRTGPQGRPHYRQVCQQIAAEAAKVDPSVFQSIEVDMNDYSLSRRESEKKIDKKLSQLERK